MLGLEEMMVQAEDDRRIDIGLGRTGEDNLSCTAVEMAGGDLLFDKTAAAFENDIDIEFLPGQARDVSFVEDADRVASHRNNFV